MKRNLKLFIFATAILCGMLFVASSSKTDFNPMPAQPANGSVKNAGTVTNSIASAIQAYSDSQLYIILFAQFHHNLKQLKKLITPV